jgi:hypothetical protein
LEVGQTVTNVDFGNHETNPQTGEVHGFKWFDLDFDRKRGPLEGGIANVTIYADLNNNGQLDAGEPSTQTMADDPNTPNVNETGMYWLADLPPTTIVIREVVPPTFIQTFPQNGSHTVVLTPGRSRIATSATRPGRISPCMASSGSTTYRHASIEPGVGNVTIYSDVNANAINLASRHDDDGRQSGDADERTRKYWLDLDRASI